MQEHGHDSLAYFALRRDKSYFFSPSGRSFLAYRVVGGTALVAGDPIGDERERHELMRGVPRASRTRRAGASRSPARRTTRSPTTRRSASSRSTSATRRSSDPPTFSLEGRAIRKVRQSVSRLEKSGLQRCACSSTARRRRDAARASCARSRRSGAATGRSAASRWRWTRCSSTRTPCSPSRSAPTARVGGFLQLVPVAGERRLLALVDAPPPRHAERADGVPDHRDVRVGAASTP